MAHQSGGFTTGGSQRLPGSGDAGRVGGGDELLGFIALWRFLKAAFSGARRSVEGFDGGVARLDGMDLVDGVDC